MSRKLSLAIIAVAAALVIPSLALTAQESDSCQKCPNCHAIEFELVGVDLPMTETEQDKTSKSEATSKKNAVSIQVECNCDIPFLNNLPLINHIFRSSTTEECEIFVVDDESDFCCDSCTEGCNGCKKCDCTCCGDKQKEVKFEVTCDGVPFLSRLPYINPLFKNVGVTAVQSRECQDCDCSAACAKTECPAARCGNLACETAECRVDALLQLASHHEASNKANTSSTDELMHELMAMRMENERLETKVQTMAQQMELMKEISNVRAENAALKAQLKLMEMHKTETTSLKNYHRPTEVHRVAEILRAKRIELNNGSECSKNESGCKTESSK